MRSLRNRIIVLFGLLLSVAGLFTGLLIRQAAYHPISEDLSQDVTRVANQLKQRISKGIDQSIEEQAKILSDSVKAPLTLFDSRGAVVVDTGPGRDHDAFSRSPEVKAALAGNEEQHYLDIRGDTLYAAYPIIEDGTVQGAVRLRFDLAETKRFLNQVWFSLGGGMLILFIGGSLAGSWLVNRAVERVDAYTRSALILAENNLYPGFSADGQDEVGRLGKAMGRMVESMQQQIRTIRSSEQRLIGIFDTMESGILMVDPSGKISLTNRTFEQLTGIRASEVMGKEYKQVANPVKLGTLIEECLQSGERVIGEIPIYFPEERILEARLTPMWAEKEGMGVVAVILDMTAIRRLENLRTDFVANVSHELKTPVTSLRGFAETLLDGALEDPKTAREFLEIIYRESVRLERLIEDLLNLSRIESKQMTLQMKQVPVDQLIDATVQTLQKEIEMRGLRLQVEVPDRFYVTVDPDRFHQILLNLLSNAMSYTLEGGITVQAGRGPTHWWLRVRDTGIGIPEEDVPRIFERFYRVDKARSRESGGTGLGLAIVKHLVDVHRGEISVASKVNEGTTVTLSFPLSEDD